MTIESMWPGWRVLDERGVPVAWFFSLAKARAYIAARFK